MEIVTVCLELTGAETARPLIEAAQPEHPSLIDVGHEMDARFGVVNIPNGIWIDEQGTIVRPAEPAWSGTPLEMPRFGDAPADDDRTKKMRSALAGKIDIDRDSYAMAVRDWAAKGEDSVYALTPDEVVARSHPQSPDVARAAAHFEIAQHLWRAGERDAALRHFRHAHRLQPDNWTYKRQAWSLVSSESVPGLAGRFMQGPVPGREDEWPFDSSFLQDVQQLEPGVYYPQTI